MNNAGKPKDKVVQFTVFKKKSKVQKDIQRTQAWFDKLSLALKAEIIKTLIKIMYR